MRDLTLFRQKLFHSRSRAYRCSDCNTTAFRDFEYNLRGDIWLSIARKSDVLCIDCAERRLGRPVNLADLPPFPINTMLFRVFGGRPTAHMLDIERRFEERRAIVRELRERPFGDE